MDSTKGYIHVYTGNGKGKTTAAFGLAVRALCAGKSVYIGQFVKSMRYNETKIGQLFDQVKIEQLGRGCFIGKDPEAIDIRMARDGLTRCATLLESGEYDVVILDELTIAPTSFRLAGIASTLSGGMNLEGMELDMLSELKIPREMLSASLNQTIDKAVSTLSSLGVKTSIGQTIDIAGVITGPASSPRYAVAYGPDRSASLGEYLKKETEKAAQKAVDQAKAKAEEQVQQQTEKLKDKAADALKGLLGRKS